MSRRSLLRVLHMYNSMGYCMTMHPAAAFFAAYLGCLHVCTDGVADCRCGKRQSSSTYSSNKYYTAQTTNRHTPTC